LPKSHDSTLGLGERYGEIEYRVGRVIRYTTMAWFKR